MCDESFSINCTVTPPEDVDKGWFMFFVTLLNHLYWVCGATAGALLGYVIHFDTTGIEFVMTALFVVMFMGQWEEHPDHRPALIGLVIPIVCLFVFGSQNFIIPSMALIIVCFMTLKKYLQPEVTRFLPFLIFPEGKTPPAYIQYLGKVLPYAVIGLLVIYCLKDVPASSTYGLPEAIAILFIMVLHKWKKNTLLSIGGGTILYMILVQMVF